MGVYGQVVTNDDLLQSIITIEQLVQRVPEQATVALVNRQLYGVPTFIERLKERGIKSIVGLTASITFSEQLTIPVYVYAKGYEGYLNLLKLSSAAETQQQIEPHWFRAYSEHCIVVVPLNRDGNWMSSYEQIVHIIQQAHDTTSYYVAVSRQWGIDREREEEAIRFFDAIDVPITYFHEARYWTERDQVTYRIARAIASTCTVDEVEESMQYRWLSTAERDERYRDRPEWIARYDALFHLCTSFTLPDTLQMPRYDAANREQLLRERCAKGLERIGKRGEARYERRLQHELEVVTRLQFVDYFLVVADIVQYAKRRNYAVGPGRGSSASSLVAYTLGITDVDPLQYGLLFERFLNEDRVTIPDIDIDIQDNKRLEVVRAVQQRYGAQYVAQIGTFGTLTMRAVVRAVARALQFSKEEVEWIMQQLRHTKATTLEDALRRAPALRQMNDVRYEQLWDASIQLEHFPRSHSIHAAGIVISPRPLVELVPLQQSDHDLYVTQWPMQQVERVGLVKIDLLSLRNLTILQRMMETLQYERVWQGTVEHIPLDDEATYALFRAGDTDGIFQFESDGMKEALRLIQPTTFEHLVVSNALYRPGPMAQIPLFAARKLGKEAIPTVSVEVDRILRETYGIIVYQEQVMQIAAAVARFTYAEADRLRRAMSKKNEHEMERWHETFVQRAIQNGYDAEEAERIFQLIAQFAQYGFPKSHAVAYSLISYRLAFIKANYPAHFYAAMLSYTGHDQLQRWVDEVKRANIPLLPPSLQSSAYQYTVEGDAIRVGLKQIVGLPRDFYAKWKEIRRHEPMTHFYDVTNRLGPYATKPILNVLIAAGAFDEWRGELSVRQYRSSCRRSIQVAINEANRPHSAISLQPKFHLATEQQLLTEEEMLQLEKEALRFYVSAHPIEEVRRTWPRDTVVSRDVAQRVGHFVRMLGTVQTVDKKFTKNGEWMALIRFQDESGALLGVLFPKTYRQYDEQLQEGEMYEIEGRIRPFQQQLQIVVERLQRLM